MIAKQNKTRVARESRGKIDRETWGWLTRAGSEAIHPADLRAARRGARFDRERAVHPLEFGRRFLRLYEGDHAGELIDWMPWQEDFLAQLFGWVVWDPGRRRWVRRFRKASLWVPKKSGKALWINTPIATPTGWTTMGELQPGDLVFDERGIACRVLAATPVFSGPCYRLTFSDGAQIICDERHLWQTSTLKPEATTSVKTTAEIVATLDMTRETGEIWAKNHSVPFAGALRLPEIELPIEPYTLGVWLGDGDSDAGRITHHADDAEILQRLAEVGTSVASTWIKPGTRVHRTRLICQQGQPLQTLLRQLGVYKNKHIPAIYLRASAAQRLALLQGLMDTDGCCSPRGQCTFTSTNLRLGEQVRELAYTLGLKPLLTLKDTKLNGRSYEPHAHVSFHAYANQPVFRLQRKRDRQAANPWKATRSRSRQIVHAEEVGELPVKCIQVDSPSHLYLAGRELVPTHNSPLLAAIGLYLLCGDGEPGQKVYFAAKDGTQAREIAGKHAVEMVQSSLELSAACEINKNLMQITHTASRSILKPLSSSNSRTTQAKEGLNGSVLVDETHVVDREFMRRVEKAGISRAEPLMLEVSTAGTNPEGYGKEQWDYGMKVASGAIEDDRFLFVAYAAPQDVSDQDLIANPVKYGKQANPSWGRTMYEAEYLDDFQRSQRSLTAWADFKMYRLNIWQHSSNPWLPMAAWEKCGAEFTLDELAGLPCWAALDGGGTQDTTALVWLFRGDQFFYVWPMYWLCEGRARELANEVRLLDWAQQGHLTLTPGDAGDHEPVIEAFAKWYPVLRPQQLLYDPTAVDQTTIRMCRSVGEDEGSFRVKFQQYPRYYNEPTNKFEALVLDGKLRHPRNPLLTYQVGNVKLLKTIDGDKKPIKPDHGGYQTVDGVQAAVMALAGEMTGEEPSMYENRREF